MEQQAKQDAGREETGIGTLIPIREAAEMAGLHPSTLRRYVKAGDFVAPVAFGLRGLQSAGPRKDGKPRRSQAVRFWRHEVEEFLRNLPRTTHLEADL